MRGKVVSIVNKLLEEYNKNELFDLPITVEKGSEVFPTIFKRMESYLDFFKNTPYLSHYYEEANEIVMTLKESIKAYWNGEINKANDNIKTLFEIIKRIDVYNLIIQPINQCLFDDEKKQLYKARTGDYYGHNIDQMFHISFLDRGKIQNQRYSINGIPCLYLGTSAYVCWEELNRPNINSFLLSRFEILKNLKILNLSYTSTDIKSYLNETGDLNYIFENTEILDKEKGIVTLLLCWIIQCVCSISVKDKRRVFREEYIYSQLIMQNLYTYNIDGIMYFSTRGNYSNYKYPWIMKNIALPAYDYDVFTHNNFDNDKYNNYILSNNLKSAFSLTKPVNMGLTTVSKKHIVKKQGIAINWYREHCTLLDNVEYRDTDFFKLEEYLCEMKAQKL